MDKAAKDKKSKTVRLAEFLGMEDRQGIVLTQTELSALNGKGPREGGSDVKNPKS